MGVRDFFPAEPADLTLRFAASAESVRGDRGTVGLVGVTTGDTGRGAGSVAEACVCACACAVPVRLKPSIPND